MSFNSRESSLDAGTPVRLYEFKRGVIRWLYNSSDRDITWGSRIFRTLVGGISDDGIRQTGQPSADALSVTAPASIEVAQLYRGVPPSNPIDLVVYDTHYGDTEVLASWMGEIASVSWPALDRCTIKAVSFEAALEQPGLRMTWQRGCPHTVFGRACGLDRNLWKFSTTVQSLTGSAIHSGGFEGFPDGWFTGGWVEWPIGDNELDSRAIESHVGSELRLLAGTARIAPGQDVVVYPGCSQVIQICHSKFGNVPNYGGIAHLSGRSPFDGNPVF